MYRIGSDPVLPIRSYGAYCIAVFRLKEKHMNDTMDVVVVGAGQAGLAVSSELGQYGTFSDFTKTDCHGF